MKEKSSRERSTDGGQRRPSGRGEGGSEEENHSKAQGNGAPRSVSQDNSPERRKSETAYEKDTPHT